MRRIVKWAVAFVVLVLVIGVGLGWQSDRDPNVLKAKYTNDASKFVDLGNGLKVHTRDEGERDGPALLLIHGSNSSLQTWEPWVKKLGPKYRIISLDLPGHGLTGENPSHDYHYAEMVRVVDGVMNKLGISKFAIAGNSMGGGVAWNYTLAHPEKVTALGLVDSSGAPEWKAKSIPLGFRLARMPILKNAVRYVTPRSLLEKSLRQSVSNQAIVTDAMIDRYWELLLFPGNRQATLDRFALVHNIEPASPEKLAAIKVPTLIQWGNEDGLIPLSSADWFEKAIPGSKKIVYTGIGHVPMEEAADQSATDMDAFLAEALKTKR